MLGAMLGAMSCGTAADAALGRSRFPSLAIFFPGLMAGPCELSGLAK